MKNIMKLWFCLLAIVLSSTLVEAGENMRKISVLYLRIAAPERPVLSNLDPTPDNLGRAGAELAVADNNTTGGFMGYQFAMKLIDLDEGNLAGARDALHASDAPFVLLDMSAEQMLTLVDESEARLFFNMRSYDDSLRGADCRASLLHTLPSYAMRADALMQFVLKKRWVVSWLVRL